jgi:hypothetical protein
LISIRLLRGLEVDLLELEVAVLMLEQYSTLKAETGHMPVKITATASLHDQICERPILEVK